MARPHVPQFGKWEAEGNVPYTVYFDKARQGRGGKPINPNDPQENPEAFANRGPAAHPTRPRTEHDESGKHGPTHERKTSREDPNLKQANAGRRADGPAQYQQAGGAGEGNRRSGRTSLGSENSIDRSPLHPHHQAKITGRGSGSPSWEGKGSTNGFHGTPGRSRLRGRDDDLDRGAAVPKFGEWDEANPASADGFTHIFNKVREERHTGTPNITTETHDYTRHSHNSDQKAKGCCFPWGR
uniref:RIN4 pathogenic type III effector avirulence factor Avr cleavage site domain-containing protein n=1 Tax=Kalanchoe fedtschenkoi TaxID=63787 RepID=A0A7N0U4D1_KALFE